MATAWNYSATQLETEVACERLAWFIYGPQGRRPPDDPSRLFGSNMHSELERLERGEPLQGFEPTRVRAVAKELARIEAERFPKLWPVERQIEIIKDPTLVKSIFDPRAGVHVELPFQIKLPDAPDGGKRSVKGAIDILDGRDPTIPEVTDHKTSSDPSKYAKTENELWQNSQLTIYAKYAIDVAPQAEAVKVRHIVIASKGGPRVYTTEAVMKRQEIEDRFASYMPRFANIDRLRVLPNAADAAPTGQAIGHCHKYRGCYFKTECASAIFSSLNTLPITHPAPTVAPQPVLAPQGSNIMADDNLAAKLAALRNGAAAPAAQAQPPAASNVLPFAQPAPQVQPGAAVSPPWAQPAQAPAPTFVAPPPPSAPVDGLAAIKAAKAAEAAYAASQAQPAWSPPAQQPAPSAAPFVTLIAPGVAANPPANIIGGAPAPAPVASTTKIGTLYVNCAPTKGGDAVRFEDWIAPVLDEIRKATGKLWQEHDYRGGIALVIRGIGSINGAQSMIVNTDHDLGKLALEALIPISGVVVEARR